MKPTPIELEMPMGKDINGAEHREPWKAYDIDEVDALLAEKDAEIAQLQAMLEERNKRVGELKAYIVYTPMDGTAEGLWELDNIILEGEEVYLANAADEVIKELKAQKAQAEEDCAYWKTKAQRERHHKYKRCVTEAKICQLRLQRYERYLCEYKGRDGRRIVARWLFLRNYYGRWHERWLKLAEKFKPNH